MDVKNNIIPKEHFVYKQLKKAANHSKVVVFSGLPGTGKSLFINQFYAISKALGRSTDVIQWDMARKAFETPEISSLYPMGDGEVHNGVRLSAGKWLIYVLKNWLKTNEKNKNMLLIEAPLVGNRFIELANIQKDLVLEKFLRSETFTVLVPIPSKEVRAKIEADRRIQLSDNAQQWMGAKPSVMLMVWKMLCGVANIFGRNINMDGQPPYDPEVYEFVFRKVLKHRHFKPLYVDTVFPVVVENEKMLHGLESLSADSETALKFVKQTNAEFPNDKTLETWVEKWYLT